MHCVASKENQRVHGPEKSACCSLRADGPHGRSTPSGLCLLTAKQTNPCDVLKLYTDKNIHDRINYKLLLLNKEGTKGHRRAAWGQPHLPGT